MESTEQNIYLFIKHIVVTFNRVSCVTGCDLLFIISIRNIYRDQNF